jgi:hypothetical protein
VESLWNVTDSFPTNLVSSTSRIHFPGAGGPRALGISSELVTSRTQTAQKLNRIPTNIVTLEKLAGKEGEAKPVRLQEKL